MHGYTTGFWWAGGFFAAAMVGDGAQKMEEAGVGPLPHHVTNVVITNDEDDVATAESTILMLMRNGGMESATQPDALS